MPTIRLPARFESLAKFRDFVSIAAKKAGLDEDGIYACQLAVDEACSNIIDHAYQGEGKGEIECTCSTTHGEIEIMLRDWGRGFDPQSVAEPDLTVPIEQARLRGAGLYLIRRLMDDVRFEFSPQNGNLIILFKKA